MPNYRRAYVPGGTFFFTLVTAGRGSFLCDDVARKILHDVLRDCGLRQPFTLEAMVLLKSGSDEVCMKKIGDAYATANLKMRPISRCCQKRRWKPPENSSG
jgi:putative transposase